MLISYIQSFLTDRSEKDIKRTYKSILDLGAGPGHFSKLIESKMTDKIVMLELSSMYVHFDWTRTHTITRKDAAS